MTKLRNTTTGEIVVERLEVASNWWGRFRGLMMRPSLAPGSGLLIAPCASIHMMWMRFSIDAIWLDGEGRVIKVSPHVPPWVGIARGGRSARSVVELPEHAAANVQPGHHLVVEP